MHREKWDFHYKTWDWHYWRLKSRVLTRRRKMTSSSVALCHSASVCTHFLGYAIVYAPRLWHVNVVNNHSKFLQIKINTVRLNVKKWNQIFYRKKTVRHSTTDGVLCSVLVTIPSKKINFWKMYNNEQWTGSCFKQQQLRADT